MPALALVDRWEVGGAVLRRCAGLFGDGIVPRTRELLHSSNTVTGVVIDTYACGSAHPTHGGIGAEFGKDTPYTDR